MKNLRLFVIALFSFFAATNATFAQTTPGSLEYMNEFSASYEGIKNDTWQYLKAITRGKGARKVDAKRQKLISEIAAAKSAAAKKLGFKGDVAYRDIVKDYFDMSLTVLKEDFDKILNMEDIAEQSYDAMEAYLLAKEKANDKLEEAFDKLVAGQKAFADKHNINILEAENSKTDDKIEKAAKTLGYYNKVYLIFFKVYKQEMYVLDALAKNDISAFEQNNATLESDARAALETLKTMESFDGDATLLTAAKDIMNFYLRESTKDFAAISDFFLKKDQYEKVKKNFDAIKPKSRTQEDVDAMNKAGSEYNEAVQKYNKVNESLNKERSTFLNQWNKKVEGFFDKYAA